MSYLMDYGDDWPPRPVRGRRSLLRWLNEGKRRARPGFDRFFWINTVVIVGVAVVCAIAMKLTDRPSPRFVVGNQSPPPAHGKTFDHVRQHPPSSVHER
jgi:hypothetical protein